MSRHTTILIADDEATVREVVRRYLERDGYRVLEAQKGPEVLHLLSEATIDLLLLDIMLPGLDGFSIMRALRDPARKQSSADNDVPVIMLTARTAEDDRVMGFELGADDYVVKPFSPRELVMRVRAVLRRSGGEGDDPLGLNNQPPIEFGELRLEPTTRAVTRGGVAIMLTAKEFELLWLMARYPRQVFTRAQLLDQIWGYEFYGDESTVTVHMHRLREKIEPNPAQPSYIHTVWGVGYKFEAL